MSDWDMWSEVHDAPEQKTRIAKSKSKAYAPLEINKADCTAIFAGSGGNKYETSLVECTCRDYYVRRLPCKHMYRLAGELNLLANYSASDGSLVIDPEPSQDEKNAMLAAAVALVEKYPESLQTDVYEALNADIQKSTYYKDSVEGLQQAIDDQILVCEKDYKAIIACNTQKHTVNTLLESGFEFPSYLKPTKRARYEWCLENADVVGPIVYPNAVVLLPGTKVRYIRKRLRDSLPKPERQKFNYWLYQMGQNPADQDDKNIK